MWRWRNWERTQVYEVTKDSPEMKRFWLASGNNNSYESVLLHRPHGSSPISEAADFSKKSVSCR